MEISTSSIGEEEDFLRGMTLTRSASFHQGTTDVFGYQTAGRQCTAIAFRFVTCALRSDVPNLTSDDLDSLIIDGNYN